MSAEPEVPRKPAHRFKAIDGLRGLAALLVVIFHLQVYSHFAITDWFRNIMSLMDFFFVLSGFVMSATFYRRIRDGRQVAGYVIRRFGRIWPLHMAVLSVFVALELARLLVGGSYLESEVFTGPKSPEMLAANVLMIHALGVSPTPTWNYPAWSISVEFAAYLAFIPFALLRISRPGLLATGLAVAAAAMVYRFAPDYMNADVGFGVFRCMAGFFLGFCVWRVYARFIEGRKASFLLWSLIECLMMAAVWLYIDRIHEGPWTMLAPFLYAGFVFTFIVEAGFVSRLVAWKPFLYLGTWSYSVYMIHALILVLSAFGMKILAAKTALIETVVVQGPLSPGEVFDLGGLWVGDVVVLLHLTVVILIASVSFRLIEEPCRLYSQRIAARYEARQAAVSISPAS